MKTLLTAREKIKLFKTVFAFENCANDEHISNPNDWVSKWYGAFKVLEILGLQHEYFEWLSKYKLN